MDKNSLKIEIDRSTALEIPYLDPKDLLPQEDEVESGKKDFELVIRTLPPNISDLPLQAAPTFKKYLLENNHVSEGVRGCFIGLSAHTSVLSYALTIQEAKELRDHLIRYTNNRFDLITIPVIDSPDLANIHLINIVAAKRIINTYHNIFPSEARVSTYEFIRRILNGPRDKMFHLYMGLLSGFPVESIIAFVNDPSSLSTIKIIPGVGTYCSVGTVEEEEYDRQARRVYKNSGIGDMVFKL